jgi:hypothetical protein
MTDKFEAILDESISALQAGVAIEDILAEVPEYAGELRPMLYAAMLLADPKPELLPDAQKETLRGEYLAQVATLPPVHPTFSEKVTAATHVIRKRATPRTVVSDLLTITITVMLTLLMAMAILGYTARDSLPGDVLYGLKLATEQTQLLLTFNEAQQQSLRQRFNQSRLDEIQQLSRLNRAAVIKFSGMLETKGDSLWVIGGLPVFIPDDARVDRDLREGATVKVVGLLRSNNVLVADSVEPVEQEQ